MNSDEKPIKSEIVRQDTDDLTTYHYIDTERKIDIKSKEVFKKEDKFIIYPFYQNKKSGEIKSKYKNIQSFTFEGFGGSIPSGFIKSPKWGYGVTKQLKSMMKLLSKLTINNITISKQRETLLDANTLTISYKDFEKVRKKIAFILSICSERTRTTINNSFAEIMPRTFSSKVQKCKPGTINGFLSFCEVTNPSKADKERLNEIVERLALMSKESENTYLITTREKIERKFIEDILSQYTKHLKNKKTSEETWQAFFKKNSWIFYQLFAYPTVLFKDKAYVGGKTVTDAQGKIVDFLYNHKLTRNSALIEIKTAEKLLLSSAPYRGNDVYSMSKELSGAISQVLDQKHNYTQDFKSIVTDGKLISFNPKCIVLIGRLDKLNDKQKASFELIRSSLKDVEIVTFDELYERIDSVLKIFKND